MQLASAHLKTGRKTTNRPRSPPITGALSNDVMPSLTPRELRCVQGSFFLTFVLILQWIYTNKRLKKEEKKKHYDRLRKTIQDYNFKIELKNQF